MALDVDSSAPGASRELGALRRRHLGVGLAVPLHEFLQDHRARRHVDAQREGLRREHHLDQAGREEGLDRLLEDGEQARVVRRDPPAQRVRPGPEAQHLKVLGGQRGAPLVDHGLDPGALLGRREADACGNHLRHRRFARGAGEDEDDRRQQARPVQPVHHERPGRGPHGRPRATPSGRPVLGASAAGAPRAVRRARGARGAAYGFGEIGVDGRVRAGVGGVDARRVEVQDALAHHDVLPQRHRPAFGDHHGHLSPHRCQPLPELLGVRDRGGQRDELHVVGEVDDHLLPYGTAVAVGEVVDLVHDYVPQPVEGRGVGVQHVPQDLGGHHHHRSLTVDRGVPGEQPDVLGAVTGHQVHELLVAQRLDGGRVEGLAALPETQVDGELPHHRLARARRCGDQHAAAAFDGAARLHLERVQVELQALAEDRQFGPRVRRALLGRGVPLRRRG